MLTTQGSVAQPFLSCWVDQKGNVALWRLQEGFEKVKFWVSGHCLCSVWFSRGSENIGQEGEIASLPGHRAFTVL